MYFLNNEYLMTLIQENCTVIIPIMFPALYKSSKAHWNRSIHSLVFTALKVFSDINMSLFDECSARYKAEMQAEDEHKRARQAKWDKVVQLAMKNPLASKVGIFKPALPTAIPTTVPRGGARRQATLDEAWSQDPEAGVPSVSTKSRRRMMLFLTVKTQTVFVLSMRHE